MLRFAEAADIDRSQPLRFTFDGRKCVGYRGDTLASALLGCGILRTGTSPILRRPRGVTGIGAFDDHAAVRLLDHGRGVTCAPAAITLYDGLEARSAGNTGSAVGRLLFGERDADTTPPLTHIDAAAAALRTAPIEAADAAVEKIHLHTDVFIIGGGTAGTALALHTAAAGLRTLVCDRNAHADMRAFPADAALHAERAAALRDAFTDAAAAGHIRFLPRTQVLQRNEDGTFLALRYPHAVMGEGVLRGYLIHARFCAVAHGARELPLPFANNDLPGIMPAGVMRRYAQRYGVAPGSAVLVACNNDSAYEAAFLLHRSGVKIKGIVDARRNPGAAMQAALGRGIDVHQGTVLRSVEGKNRPEHAELVPAEGTLEERRRQRRLLACDAIAVSGGFVPKFAEAFGSDAVRVGAASGAGPTFSAVLHDVRRVAAAALRACGTAGEPLFYEETDETPDIVRCIAPDAGAASREIELSDKVFFPGYGEWTLARAAHLPDETALPSPDDLPSIVALRAQAGVRDGDGDALLTERLRRPVQRIAAALAAVEIGARRVSPLQPLLLEMKAHMVPQGAFARPAYFQREGGAQRRVEASASDVRFEYDALMNGCGIVDRSADGAVRLVGPDAIVLAAVFGGCATPPRAGAGTRLRPADARGLLLGDVLCAVIDAHDVLLLPACGDLDVLTRRVEHLRLHGAHMLQVAVRDRREAEARLTLCGPKAVEICRVLLPNLRSNVSALEVAGLRADAVMDPERQEVELCVPARHAQTLFQAAVRAGAVPVGELARDVVRIERGLPGINELRRAPHADADTGTAVIGIRSLRKLADAHAAAPEYLLADNRRAAVTSWCYAPGSDRCVGLAVTEHREAFIGRADIYARNAAAQTIPVACFMPEAVRA